MRKLYGYIVGKCGVSPSYFFDEMTFAEVNALVDSYDEDFRNGWEQIRTLAHAVIASQSSKPVKPEDVLKFEWDKEQTKSTTKLTETDRERLLKKVKKE